MKIFNSISTKFSKGNQYPLFNVLICVEFFVAFTIFTFALVGIAIDMHTASTLLLAVIQTLITIPGYYYIANESAVMLCVFCNLQCMVGGVEFIWMIYCITNDLPISRTLILLALALLQALNAIVGLFFKKAQIRLCCVSDTDTDISEKSGTSWARTGGDQVEICVSPPDFKNRGGLSAGGECDLEQALENEGRRVAGSETTEFSEEREQQPEEGKKKRRPRLSRMAKKLRKGIAQMSVEQTTTRGAASPIEKNIFAQCTVEDGNKNVQKILDRLEVTTPEDSTATSIN